MRPIPLVDLQAQHATLRVEIEAAVAEVFASQRFILGPHGEALERALAAEAAVAHGIGMSSGTDALLATYMALGIGPGDVVVTSPYSFYATAAAARGLGAEAAFVDIEPRSFNLDPERLADFLARDSRAGRARVLVPVHLYGRMADMPRLMALAGERGLAVVEDAAQAIGSRLEGRAACAFGLAGTLSFFPSKNLGGAGDGGMVLTRDAELAARLRALRHHGEGTAGGERLLGGNFRLDELQAAVLLVKLRHLAAWTEARRRNAARYDDLLRKAGLAPGVVTLPEEGPGRHVYNQYVIRCAHRDALRKALAAAGIASAVYYPRPLHREPSLTLGASGPCDCPEAERAARETLALPMYPELSAEDQTRVVAVMVEFFAARAARGVEMEGS